MASHNPLIMFLFLAKWIWFNYLLGHFVQLKIVAHFGFELGWQHSF